MNIPPSFSFSGNIDSAKLLISRARQFYNFITQQADLGGIPFINRRLILDDGSVIEIRSYREKNFNHRSGLISIFSPVIISEEILKGNIIHLADDSFFATHALYLGNEYKQDSKYLVKPPDTYVKKGLITFPRIPVSTSHSYFLNDKLEFETIFRAPNNMSGWLGNVFDVFGIEIYEERIYLKDGSHINLGVYNPYDAIKTTADEFKAVVSKDTIGRVYYRDFSSPYNIQTIKIVSGTGALLSSLNQDVTITIRQLTSTTMEIQATFLDMTVVTENIGNSATTGSFGVIDSKISPDGKECSLLLSVEATNFTITPGSTALHDTFDIVVDLESKEMSVTPYLQQGLYTLERNSAENIITTPNTKTIVDSYDLIATHDTLGITATVRYNLYDILQGDFNYTHTNEYEMFGTQYVGYKYSISSTGVISRDFIELAWSTLEGLSFVKQTGPLKSNYLGSSNISTESPGFLSTFLDPFSIKAEVINWSNFPPSIVTTEWNLTNPLFNVLPSGWSFDSSEFAAAGNQFANYVASTSRSGSTKWNKNLNGFEVVRPALFIGNSLLGFSNGKYVVAPNNSKYSEDINLTHSVDLEGVHLIIDETTVANQGNVLIGNESYSGSIRGFRELDSIGVSVYPNINSGQSVLINSGGRLNTEYYHPWAGLKIGYKIVSTDNICQYEFTNNGKNYVVSNTSTNVPVATPVIQDIEEDLFFTYRGSGAGSYSDVSSINEVTFITKDAYGLIAPLNKELLSIVYTIDDSILNIANFNNQYTLDTGANKIVIFNGNTFTTIPEIVPDIDITTGRIRAGAGIKL